MTDVPPRHPDFTRWPLVEGYCDPLSVTGGDRVAVHCASRADTFSVLVTRCGATRQQVWAEHGLRAADPDLDGSESSAGCQWPTTCTVEVGADWPSGFYEVALVADGAAPGDARARSEAYFVVRGAHRPGGRPPLLVLATNTYNAYNQWGGRCLYSGAHAVSFARPLERGYLRRPSAPDEVDYDGRITNIDTPSDPEHLRLQRYQAEGNWPLWTASSGWHNWERRFVRWAEGTGIELDYAISSDLHGRPGLLDGRRLLLSVGHDEYWSWEMRDAVDAFVDQGGNWAILSGNTCFWQVRYEDDGRTMVCHKGRARRDDPAMRSDRSRITSMWSDPVIGRPETATTGLTFSRGGYHRIGQGVPRGTGAYTVHRPDHWLFDGTGLRYGDQLGAGAFVVGYEVDGCAMTMVDGRPVPTHEDGAPDTLEILATAPARLLSITADVCEAPRALWASVEPPGDLEGTAMILFGDASPEHVARIEHGNAAVATFRRGDGTVVNLGSADWAYGLDTDPLVQQVTRNIVATLG